LRGIVSHCSFYGNLERYFKGAGLPPAGVQVFRHSAAKLRRDVGESIESVCQFLAHSSLAVTTVYLRRLEGQEDRAWAKVAESIGVWARLPGLSAAAALVRDDRNSRSRPYLSLAASLRNHRPQSG